MLDSETSCITNPSKCIMYRHLQIIGKHFFDVIVPQFVKNETCIAFNFCFQTSADGIYLTRHIGLRLGVPTGVPALTVNRLCGSGFQAIVNAAQVCYVFRCVSAK